MTPEGVSSLKDFHTWIGRASADEMLRLAPCASGKRE